MTNQLKCKQQGFSLLETLVAFAILVLVLSVTMQIYGSGSRSSRLTQQYTQATVIAQSKLAELSTGMKHLSGTELERYHWQVEQTQSSHTDLFRAKNYQRSFIAYDVRVTVNWHSAGKQREIFIDTVQLKNQQ